MHHLLSVRLTHACPGYRFTHPRRTVVGDVLELPGSIGGPPHWAKACCANACGAGCGTLVGVSAYVRRIAALRVPTILSKPRRVSRMPRFCGVGRRGPPVRCCSPPIPHIHLAFRLTQRRTDVLRIVADGIAPPPLPELAFAEPLGRVQGIAQWLLSHLRLVGDVEEVEQGVFPSN